VAHVAHLIRRGIQHILEHHALVVFHVHAVSAQAVQLAVQAVIHQVATQVVRADIALAVLVVVAQVAVASAAVVVLEVVAVLAVAQSVQWVLSTLTRTDLSTKLLSLKKQNISCQNTHSQIFKLVKI
jgi:hypothetical protein